MSIDVEDIGLYLQDFVSSLDNVPSEVVFLLRELRAKDEQFLSARAKTQAHDHELTKVLRMPLAAASHPSSCSVDVVGDEMAEHQRERADREAELYEIIQSGFNECRAIADEKIAIAARISELLTKHTKRLESDIDGFIAADMASGYGGGGGGGDDGFGVYGASGMVGMGVASGRGGSYTLDPEYFMDGGALGGSEGRDAAARKRAAAARRKKGGIKGLYVAAADTPPLLDINGNPVPEYDEDGAEADTNLYCFCQQRSFGLMVACDNEEDCPYGWFHFECVGLTEQPDGKWFCSDCATKMKPGVGA